MKYPIFGEDFQILIDHTGKVYQTDWDRIYFTYEDWSPISKNPIKIVEYLIPYLDELIRYVQSICERLLQRNNGNISNFNRSNNERTKHFMEKELFQQPKKLQTKNLVKSRVAKIKRGKIFKQ